ncbi:hypothetical protein RKD29_004586 [Streptomyces tendae]
MSEAQVRTSAFPVSSSAANLWKDLTAVAGVVSKAAVKASKR